MPESFLEFRSRYPLELEAAAHALDKGHVAISLSTTATKYGASLGVRSSSLCLRGARGDGIQYAA